MMFKKTRDKLIKKYGWKPEYTVDKMADDIWHDHNISTFVGFAVDNNGDWCIYLSNSKNKLDRFRMAGILDQMKNEMLRGED